MFNQVLLPILTTLKSAFGASDPGVKRTAGIAFFCLMGGIGLGVYTAWVAQPSYQNTLGNFIAAWTFAGVIAAIMFMCINAVACYFAEGILGIKHQVSPTLVLMILLLAISLGGYDVYRGYTEGSVQRSEQQHAMPVYSGNSQTKKYEDQIASIDSQIKTLQNEKIMWKGVMTTPDKNRKPIQNLTEQKQVALDMIAKIEASSLSAHADIIKTQTRKRVDSDNSNKMLNVWMYMLMLPLAIIVNVFTLKMDIMDGERDGRYTTSYFNDTNPYDLKETDTNNERSAAIPDVKKRSWRTSILDYIGGRLGFFKGSNLETDAFTRKFPDYESRYSFIKKYEHVIPDIRMKKEDIKAKHGIGFTTIASIRRIMREFGELEEYTKPLTDKK